MTDHPLFDAIATRESAFQRHHAESPEIYEWFCRFTLEKIHKGAKHVGAKAVWERLRFESPVREDGSPYKLNNNFTAFYARLFMQDHPQYAGIFETRTAKADEEL